MLELKDKETRAEALGKIIRARQRIELLKDYVIINSDWIFYAFV